MFNASGHLLNIGTDKKPRMYLEVKYRLVWLREEHPEAQISTEILHLDLEKEVQAEVFEWDDNLKKSVKVTKTGKGMVIFKATITLPNGASATGTKMENAAAFGDFLEKAESGAIGRALAGLGYGTQFCEGESEADSGRIVDAPVTRPSYDPDKPASEQQLTTIAKLVKDLGQVPGNLDGLNFGDAAQMLKDLSKRLQTKRATK
jgi:hypothetical protein